MNKFEEKTVSTEQIFKGKIISVQVDEVELPNGKLSKREIVRHPGAVGLIALTDDNKIVMVEQFRKPLERSLLEIPAGKLEPGENPDVTAERELEEETGYRAGNMEYISSFYTSPGFANEIIHLYLATELEKVENPAEADDDEFVELVELSLEESLVCIENDRIYDAKTIFAIQYLQLMEKK
ncbi:MAG TPA: NUDIX hydrolase [Bacillus bacterium]|uniref:ADP-ribose diphosphatase n=1 Tax=Siminovitchia fordii TaxID=254759 RepID=A0ABQ4K2A8_9BACI|nr:NUDIX hydrolase [Siminovitchia fordii]GIN19898.1 ADP-ribose diphosphatase [Siminovitchia fordii]HBZ08618.1 NUDIX hydrolase [Bacillus sp. (in: firmicutes)]